MPPVTQNLGLVKAIFIGTSAPSNTNVLWYDDNPGEKKHKYYDTVALAWLPLASSVTGTGTNNYLPKWSGSTSLTSSTVYEDGSGNVGFGTTSPTAKVHIADTFRISSGTPGLGKVLTSDALGNATWQAATGGISGSGTLNKLAKWSGTGSLTNSQLTDDLANLSIISEAHLVPGTTNTYDLGGPFTLSNKYWNALWINNAIRQNADLKFYYQGAGNEIMKLTTTGRLALGTITSPSAKMHIRGGGSSATDSFYVENDTPTVWFRLRDDRRVIYLDGNEGAGKVLTSDGSGVATWQTPSSGGISTLNTLTASTQTFATGTAGTDFAIVSATSTHTFNLPTASATNRGALSSADWTTFNNKFDLPSLTAGSVLFSNGTTIAQDNSNFFWDDTNNRLGIGTTSPNKRFHVHGAASPATLLDVAKLSYQSFGGSIGDDVGLAFGDLTNTYSRISAYTNSSGRVELRFWTNNFTSTNLNMILSGDGNLVIGNTTASARLHVQGSGTGSGTYGLQVYNNTPTLKFFVRDDGMVSATDYYAINGQKFLHNTTESTSTYVGVSAGSTTASGNTDNVGVGNQALQNQDANSLRSVAIGRDALRNNGASGNVAVGYSALSSLASTNGGNNAYYNVAIGYTAGGSATIGIENVLIGAQAGGTLTSGNRNILIGANADVSSGTVGNSIAIGKSATATNDNQFVIGSGTVPIYDYYIGTGTFGYTSTTGGGVARNIYVGQAAAGNSNVGLSTVTLNFYGARGTGSGLGGDFVFYVATAGASGTSLNTFNEAFRIKESKTISMVGLQVGNAGLSSGDLYKDTAANILANGDYVVGMKA